MNKILIVDDDKLVINSLKRALCDEPYMIYEADSMQRAIKLCEKEYFDVLLTDYMMPNGSGADLIESVQQKYPDIISIVMSGHSDFDVALDLLNRTTVYRFIVKPWNDTELIHTLRNALAKKELLNENKVLTQKLSVSMNIIDKLEKESPGITKVKRDASGAIIFDE